MASRSTDTVYRVSRPTLALPGNRPWYQRLICDCPAGDKGFPACWHKALIYLVMEGGELPTR